MPFLLIIFGVTGGVLALVLTGVFLGPTLLAVGFHFLPDCLPSERSALHEATAVDIHSR